jgi:hypothetical protein
MRPEEAGGEQAAVLAGAPLAIALLGAVVRGDVVDCVPDQRTEFGAGDIAERVSGHEQPSEDHA